MGRSPLSDYVREQMEVHRLTERELARRSEGFSDSDRRLLPQWIGDLLRGRILRTPELWRLELLAGALRADLDIIKILAARQWLDIEPDVLDVRVGEKDWVAVTVPPGLSAEKRRMIIEWAAKMAKDMDAENR